MHILHYICTTHFFFVVILKSSLNLITHSLYLPLGHSYGCPSTSEASSSNPEEFIYLTNFTNNYPQPNHVHFCCIYSTPYYIHAIIYRVCWKHNMYIPGMPSFPNVCLRNQEKCDNLNTNMSHEMWIWFVFVVVVVLAPSNLDGLFIQISQGCFTCTGAIPQMPVK